MRYRQVAELGVDLSVRWACSAVKVSERGFYNWRGREPSDREKQDRRLLVQIRAAYKASGEE